MPNQAATWTYEDVEKLIMLEVHKHIARCGGDFHECLSIANEAFMKEYQRWPGESSVASFNTWLVRNIRYRFIDDYRTRKKKSSRIEPVKDLARLQAPRDFEWRRFALELTEDAQTVLRLIFDDDAPKIIVKESDNRGGKPKDIRTTLRDYLAGAGWTAKQITDAFHEIRDALK